MSYITEVLIHGAADSNIERLNEWLLEADEERGQQFVKINMDAAGGTKWYTSDVWAAAFNYAPAGLVEKLRDPNTWRTSVYSIFIVIDGEEIGQAFCFWGNEDEGYAPTTEQDWS